jgi:HSP20 family protein
MERWKHPIGEIADFFGYHHPRWGDIPAEKIETQWPATFTSLEGPLIDLSEQNGFIKISAELPGLKKDDFTLEVLEDRVVLKGEKKAEKEEKEKDYHYSERRYGSFFRSIPLPCAVDSDGVKADFKKGVLVVTLPKAKSTKGKTIDIDAG